MQENLSTAQEEAAALLKKLIRCKQNMLNINLIKGYQTRLRALAQERENTVSEKDVKSSKGKAESARIRITEEVESLEEKRRDNGWKSKVSLNWKNRVI